MNPLRLPVMLVALAAAAALIAALTGCGQSVWPDRQPVVAEGIRIDALRFVPAGSRYVFIDSATPLLFGHFHAGYLCSEVLEMGLEPAPAARPGSYRPVSRIRLPAQADCPLDSTGRDTLVTHVFGPGGDSMAFLENSSGDVTDSATLVRGRISYDSLDHELGIAHDFQVGRWYYRDTASGMPQELASTALSSCEFLDQASYSQSGDTVKVRFSWVTLDPAPGNDSCRGARADSIPLVPHTP